MSVAEVQVQASTRTSDDGLPLAHHPESNGDAMTRERWIVAIVALSSFMTVTSGTMANVALPAIGDHFAVDTAAIGWLVTIYLLTFGIAMPFHGRLSDRFGERRIFVFGLTMFTVASSLTGLAVSFPMLLICRALQSVGAAAVTSLGIAMVARVVPSERRGRTLGIVTTAVSGGTALGPTLGGAITQYGSWRMVFLFSSLLLLVIPFALRHLPAAQPRPPVAIDWFGGVAVGMAVAGTILGITSLQRDGGLSTLVLVALGVALTGVALTVWRQRTHAAPFIERTLLANRQYLLLCLVGLLTMMGSISAYIVAPFLYRDINALSSGQVGLALLPQALAVVILSRTAGRWSDRVSPFRLIAVGSLIFSATLLVVSTFAIGWSAATFAALTVVLGIGQALVNAPLSTALTRSIPASVFGVGLGIYNMLFFVGTSLGAAIATGLLSSRESASSALLPFYRGSTQFSEYSDAFLPGVFACLLAAAVVLLAARQPGRSEPVGGSVRGSTARRR